MSTRSSFATRVLIAVGLMIGFYVLAIVLIVAILLLRYAQFAVFHRFNIFFSIACLIAIFAILRSVFFFSDPFEAPGPELVDLDRLIGAQPTEEDLQESLTALGIAHGS